MDEISKRRREIQRALNAVGKLLLRKRISYEDAQEAIDAMAKLSEKSYRHATPEQIQLLAETMLLAKAKLASKMHIEPPE